MKALLPVTDRQQYRAQTTKFQTPKAGVRWRTGYRTGLALLALSCAPIPTANSPTGSHKHAATISESAGDSNWPAQFSNPVIRGTNPDPSACRVGDDYYLVSSSFEYFPGVPIFHSRDLVHWEQIGHVLTSPEQLPLHGVASSRGIFAPTLRYHEGTFYMITTNMDGGGSFLVTARDPRGPWSDPVWIREKVFTMDPSLFFDDDGKVYYTRHGGGRHGGVFQAEINVATGQLLSEPREIWGGTGGVWPEGPHLYKVNGQYLLMISEGGTSFDHRLTVARSDSPWGPFEPAGHNPIVTHSNLPEHPIQATGHADLLDTRDGKHWLVMLGVRPSTHRRHHTGRETFLAPLSWDEQGWPVVNGGKPIALQMNTEGLPAWLPATKPAVREPFDSAQLAMHWKFVRNPRADAWSLSERPGTLRLRGGAESVDEVSSPAGVWRAQADQRVRWTTQLTFSPTDGQSAGIVVRGNEDNHYDLLVQSSGGQRTIALYVKTAGSKRLVHQVAHAQDVTQLTVEGYPDHYAFFVDHPEGGRTLLGSAPTTYFAYASTQMFTGAYLGLYAHSEGETPAIADFDWVDYEGLD